jgi:hypothetical protein
LSTGVCAAPPALANGFIFSVGPDGRLISSSQDANERLFLFAEPRGSDAVIKTAIPARTAGRASPEILNAIEATALRYAGHGALRRAGLSVTDWALLYRANIEVESAYNPAARSPVGAIGLGQLMPDTARDLGIDPHDIAQNLDGSARYLLMMLDRFGDGSLALAAYNAGPEAITRHGGIPPFQETQRHVARVTAVFQRLRGDLS